MATTKVINDLIDLNQTGNTTALKGCKGNNVQQPTAPTISVEYLVVGGGGGASGSGSGGGGAGGLSNGTIAVPNNTAVNIVIGQGGASGLHQDNPPAGQGQDSGFYQIQGQGGGAGGERDNGLPGGSGGGAGVAFTTLYSGGNGVSGQGNNGGLSSATWSAGGGGGSGAVGTNGISSQAGAGGVGSDAVALGIITQTNGVTANIGEVDGATLNFAGGGGGGGSDSAAGGNTIGGDGGLGGGGNGTGQCSNCPGGDGTLNTGGGGGGSAAATVDSIGGSGGSGVVILRYASTAVETITGSLAGGIITGTTADCNYPTTGSILYQFEDNANNTCTGGTYDANAGANVSYSASGKYGKAAEFTASTASAADVITVPDAIANLIINDFTISFWMKPDNLNYASSGYVNPIGLQKGRRFYIDITSAGAISSYNGNSVLASSNNTITTGSWFHVVYTQSSSTGRVIYVNGISTVSDGTTADTTVYNPGGSENVIGGYKSSSAWGLMFDGLIDQFRLFTSVLTANQVAMLYAENVGATKFDDGTNTTLVFKGGAGTINLTGSSTAGPQVGDLRTNTDLVSNGSTSAMEHYMATGWRVLTNTPNTFSIDYLVVGGGAGGGAWFGGGGGAGGYTAVSISAIASGILLNITVGGGGAGAPYGTNSAASGGLSSITGTGVSTSVDGGGKGGSSTAVYPGLYGGANGSSGASGGGGSGFRGGGSQSGGSANGNGTGSSGGTGVSSYADEGGGGGGAAGSGIGGRTSSGASYPDGGAGTSNSITGTAVVYSAGGGAGSGYGGNTGASGGNGYYPHSSGSIAQYNGYNGNTNTGTGGGAGAGSSSASQSYGGNGGSGVVILKIANTNYSGTITGSVTVDTSSVSGYTILIFTSGSGTYTT